MLLSSVRVEYCPKAVAVIPFLLHYDIFDAPKSKECYMLRLVVRRRQNMAYRVRRDELKTQVVRVDANMACEQASYSKPLNPEGTTMIVEAVYLLFSLYSVSSSGSRTKTANINRNLRNMDEINTAKHKLLPANISTILEHKRTYHKQNTKQ